MVKQCRGGTVSLILLLRLLILLLFRLLVLLLFDVPFLLFLLRPHHSSSSIFSSLFFYVTSVSRKTVDVVLAGIKYSLMCLRPGLVPQYKVCLYSLSTTARLPRREYRVNRDSCLDGPVVRGSPREREVRGSIPDFSGRVTPLLYFCLPLIPLGASRGKKTFAARRNAWEGGGRGGGKGEGGLGVVLYKDSVSLTPLIQIFRGRPLTVRPPSLVLYARVTPDT